MHICHRINDSYIRDLRMCDVRPSVKGFGMSMHVKSRMVPRRTPIEDRFLDLSPVAWLQIGWTSIGSVPVHVRVPRPGRPAPWCVPVPGRERTDQIGGPSQQLVAEKKFRPPYSSGSSHLWWCGPFRYISLAMIAQVQELQAKCGIGISLH